MINTTVKLIFQISQIAQHHYTHTVAIAQKKNAENLHI